MEIHGNAWSLSYDDQRIIVRNAFCDSIAAMARSTPDVPRDEQDQNALMILAAPDMLVALRRAAEQFRFYERQHRAKGTPEAEAKAKTNGEFADRIEALIARTEATLP